MSSFWNQSALEPKRSFQWVGYINLISGGAINQQSLDFGPKPFLISNFQKPIFSFTNETLINNFTSQTEIITNNYVWEDISLTIIDIQNRDSNASNAIYSWLRSLGYESSQTLTQLSKLFTNLDNNQFNIFLEHIDSDGNPLERWSFTDPQITSIDFGGQLGYDSEEIMKINIGVTYVAADYELLANSSNNTNTSNRNYTPDVGFQSLLPGVESPGGVI